MNISELLHDAVDEIEPADRIDAIRARTASDARSAARPWFYAAGGVVLATAATVAAFALLGNDPGDDSDPHHHHVATDPPDSTASFLVPAYFVGDSPDGPRLFREFDQARGSDPLQAALNRIQAPATDPDYSTPWPQGSFETATLGNGTINVEVGDATLGRADDLSMQQVAYTLKGAAELPDWTVRFVQDGEELLEIDTLPQNDVLNLVSISDPTEGWAYQGTMLARGRANSFEGNVPWEIRDEDGEVVKSGFATATGNGDRLYPWETEIDLTGIPFGYYDFVVVTDDPSGGAEQGVLFSDTRMIAVQ